MIDSQRISRSVGETKKPASPTTSGIDDVLELITGHPHCIASKSGSPKPS